MEVSVIVRRRGSGEMQSRVAALAAGERSRGAMSRDEFAQAHGAEPKDISAVRAFAATHGLAVLEEHAARRTVVLAGTVAQFCSAFSVQLHRMTHADGTYRGRTGEIMLPPELAGVVEAVLGLDNRP
jgi:kumamolisin